MSHIVGQHQAVLPVGSTYSIVSNVTFNLIYMLTGTQNNSRQPYVLGHVRMH